MNQPIAKGPAQDIHQESSRDLPTSEREELERQGAKAAARGDPSRSNPMHQAENAPAHTGESAKTWSQRNDAWQRGHDAQSRVRQAEAQPEGDSGPEER